MKQPWMLLALAGLLVASGCKREQRIFDPGKKASQLAVSPAADEVVAGGSTYTQIAANPYDGSAYALSEGKRLFSAYNCVGCHAVGGGGAIGPALSDSEWIYGSHSDQIYATIVQGRGNGMPSFAGKIPEYQVWELAAYVRSLSGQYASDIAPSRSDQMPVGKAEQSRQKEHPGDEDVQPIQHGEPRP